MCSVQPKQTLLGFNLKDCIVYFHLHFKVFILEFIFVDYFHLHFKVI